MTAVAVAARTPVLPRAARCRQCGRRVQGTGEYVPQTCGASEYQQADCCERFHLCRGNVRRKCPAGAGCLRGTNPVLPRRRDAGPPFT